MIEIIPSKSLMMWNCIANFRFRRQDIMEITDEISNDIELVNQHGTLPPLLQVMTVLRFYASGSFQIQDMCAELIGIHQSTASRAITRVTDALLRRVPGYVLMPTQEEAENSKRKSFQRNGFPNAIGAIDGTQIRIQAPIEQEHEFVNRKNFHSINVQVCLSFHTSHTVMALLFLREREDVYAFFFFYCHIL